MNDNTLALSIVVLTCSIVVFFAKEFGEGIKKIMSIRGMPLFLPLSLTTLFVVYYEANVVTVLTGLQSLLSLLIETLASLLPFKRLANFMANILVITAFPFLPVLVIKAWYKRKSFNTFKYEGITLLFVWLFLVLLIITDYDY
ncbi:hypothetical protein BN59_01950 [Legionella massiliensis]|uniref:Uncharacterized protein n=1 Tax=Legionella massiliensis TaxID=1034943 RepID=A0A078KT68_9GAMM|nr:hypothetical protein [Legionella massiliensis]CDZ77660.1 hypothetical protein BN59_01950 [Legionella massiliensis]CEE13398.1 hypothetical protein BN1094_01950 [Legionella massiliensis]